MTKFRNYNQGRVKELIINALREASTKLQVPAIDEFKRTIYFKIA